jgi:peptide/nickel transport system substrate-binding protein
VTFHDGTPFDAEAVVFNFDRMLNEDHPYHDTGPFPLSFFFSAVESVEATTTDRQVHAERALCAVPVEPRLSHRADRLARGGDGAWRRFRPQPVGHRPFTFTEWRSNEAVVIEANPDYWDGRPGFEAVVFRPITDANTRVAEMLAGGIDMMVEVPPTALSEFQGDGFTVVEQAGPMSGS